MSYTLIDFFDGFQQLRRIRQFSAGVQSTYFAILAEFHLRRFPGELELSIRDLKALAGLKSVSSTHEARNILKNNKLVDFYTRNGATVYTLGTEHLPNTSRTPAEQQPNTSRTPNSLVCYAQNYTHADTNADKAAAEPPSPSALPPAPPNPPTSSPIHSFFHPPTPQISPQGTPPTPPRDTLAQANPLRSPISEPDDHDDLDEVVEYWQHNKSGGKLSFEHQSRLSIYLQDPQKGKEWVKKMMDIASDKNGNSKALMPKFLFGVIETETHGKPTKKEGEKSGGYQYQLPPKYDIDFDED